MARAMENSVTESKRQPGRDRLRLLSAVSHLPESSLWSRTASSPDSQELAPALQNQLNGLYLATLTISESCTACGACGKACPTEALRFQKNEEEMTFSITFSVQNCIGCDVCDHVCLPDAINLNHAPTFEQVFGAKEPVIAASGTLVRCERCKVLMAKRVGVALCPLCEYRRTHPFGSMMPKKAMKESRA
jgi:ferredoxin